MDELLDQAFCDERHGTTLAVIVVQGGEVVAERYGSGVGPTTTLPSWSMAKSMLHAVVGLCIGDGTLRLDDVGPANGATLAQLLEMRDGLAWRESYDGDDEESDVIEMLWGSGRVDTAKFAATRPRAGRPGDTFCYSSGTSNVISSMVADVVGRGDDYRSFLRKRLLGPLRMASVVPKLDGAGTWIASSYCFATAGDFVRFGQLYLDEGRDLLPDGWVADGARLVSVDEDGDAYGRHWWVWDDKHGTFEARGYDGQYLAIVPELDAVVLRLGRTPVDLRPHLRPWREALISTLV